jgi:hypothetical protein
MYVYNSVPDTERFGTDPDHRIRTTGLRIRILFFYSVAFKMPTKNKLFAYKFFLLVHLLYISLQR